MLRAQGRAAAQRLSHVRSYATPASRIGQRILSKSFLTLFINVSMPAGDTKVPMSAFEQDKYINYQVRISPRRIP